MTSTGTPEAASSIPLLMIMHTAVDFLPKRGVGIAVVARAHDFENPGGELSHFIFEPQERKFSIYRESFVKENVQTAERAQMRAIIHALRMARRIIIKISKPGNACSVKRLVITGASPNTVALVNQHIALGHQSLQGMESTNDRSLLETIIIRVEALSRRGLSVSIDVAAMVGTTAAAKRAGTLSWGRGHISCAYRLQRVREMDKRKREEARMKKTRASASTGDGDEATDG